MPPRRRPAHRRVDLLAGDAVAFARSSFRAPMAKQQRKRQGRERNRCDRM